MGLNGRFILVEHDGVEGLAGRLDADMLQHRGAPIALQRIAVHERLRHGLDGEGDLGIADGIDLPVDGGDGDAKQSRIGLAELGDIVGRLAAGHFGDSRVQFRQIILDRRERRLSLGDSHRSDGINLVQRAPRVQAGAAATA